MDSCGVDVNISHAMAKTNGKLCPASGDNPIDAKLASDVGNTMPELEDSAMLVSIMKADELMATLTLCVDM